MGCAVEHSGDGEAETEEGRERGICAVVFEWGDEEEVGSGRRERVESCCDRWWGC